jgi:hypothetical protein
MTSLSAVGRFSQLTDPRQVLLSGQAASNAKDQKLRPSNQEASLKQQSAGQAAGQAMNFGALLPSGETKVVVPVQVGWYPLGRRFRLCLVVAGSGSS